MDLIHLNKTIFQGKKHEALAKISNSFQWLSSVNFSKYFTVLKKCTKSTMENDSSFAKQGVAKLQSREK